MRKQELLSNLSCDIGVLGRSFTDLMVMTIGFNFFSRSFGNKLPPTVTETYMSLTLTLGSLSREVISFIPE